MRRISLSGAHEGYMVEVRRSARAREVLSMQILIAGEDPALSLFLQRGLETDACQVGCTPHGAASAAVQSQPPDLLVLDLPNFYLVPGDRGIEILTSIRAVNDQLPILVLTASREVEARVGCLDQGADDCMMKPLSLQEVRARCRALLRRRSGASLVLRCAGLELNRISRKVAQGGRPVNLSRTEFSLLEYLMLHRGSCISRTALLAHVWNDGAPSDSNIVDVYINYLRRKLGYEGGFSMIRTVRGRGYLVDAGLPRRLPAEA